MIQDFGIPVSVLRDHGEKRDRTGSESHEYCYCWRRYVHVDVSGSNRLWKPAKKNQTEYILSSLVQASLLVTQDIEKCFLRKIDCAHSLHSSFTLFLIFEMLHLPFIMSCTKILIKRSMLWRIYWILTSIKASSDVRSHGFQCLPSYNLFSNYSLNGDLKQLPRNNPVCERSWISRYTILQWIRMAHGVYWPTADQQHLEQNDEQLGQGRRQVFRSKRMSSKRN